MRVDLSDEVVTGQVRPLVVLGIIAMGAEGRHRVLADREVIDRWLRALPHDLRDEVRLALDLGERDEALGPELLSIRVEVGDRPLTAKDPRLSPDQAMGVLARPLHVVLENGVNDRNALLAFAPTDVRAILEDAAEKGWLEFWNGGGIGGCSGRAEQLGEPTPASLRTFVVTDSDARQPGADSTQAAKLRTTLSNARIALGWDSSQSVAPPGHVLERRAMENYTPWAEFQKWLRTLNEAQQALVDEAQRSQDLSVKQWAKNLERRQLLVAQTLQDAPPEIQNHMDIDAGRERVTKKGTTIRTDNAVWDALSDWQRAVLHKGVGKATIREFFKQATGLPDASGELVAIIRAIRRLL